MALGVGIYQLRLHDVAFGVHGYSGIGYDDGVYTGAALHLVHGVLPYRDFVLLHPPGISLLLAPFAALGHARGVLGAARALTIVAAVANATLAAVVLRYRSAAAMFVAGTALACFPLAVTADQTVLLEPYLICFCLLGAVSLFQRGRFAGSWRLLLGGLALGFATAVKIWGVLPLAVALLLCVPLWRKRVAPLLSGAVVGFAVPCLPFFFLAPGSFVRDIVSSQLGRVVPAGSATPAARRLLDITGLSGLTWFHPSAWVALGLGLALVVAVAAVFVFFVVKPADWFVLGSAVLATTVLFFTNSYSDHYAYFSAPFLAMLAGICASHVVGGLRGSKRRLARRAAGLSLPVALAVAAAAFLLPQQASYARSYLASATDTAPLLERFIPPRACVVADEVTYLVAADRFGSSSSSCPAVVDAYGVWFTSFPQHLPPYPGPYPSAFTAKWGRWFAAADFAVLTAPQTDIIPWSGALAGWFASDFQLVYSQPGLYVYKHAVRTPPPGPGAPTGTAGALVLQGLSAQRSGDIAGAISDYQAALRADPGNFYAHFDLGTIYQQRGDLTNAALQYQDALRTNPTFGPALYNLAVLETPTAPASAISYFEQDLQVEPDNASANFDLGILLIKSGKVASGDGYVQKGVRLNPALAKSIPPGITVPGVNG
jgi:hypothetical protein